METHLEQREELPFKFEMREGASRVFFFSIDKRGWGQELYSPSLHFSIIGNERGGGDGDKDRKNVRSHIVGEGNETFFIRV